MRHTLCLALVLGPVVAEAQNLVCSEESVAGIVYDRTAKTWNSTRSKPSEKFVVRKSANPLARFEVTKLGTKSPTAFCEKEFEEGQLRCRGFFQEFFFSATDMRFVRIYYAGYWNESSLKGIAPERREGDDSPFVSAGVCSAL